MIVVNSSDIQNVKFAVVRENRAYYHRRHICKPHVNNVYYQYTFNETLESIVFALYRIIIVDSKTHRHSKLVQHTCPRVCNYNK